MSIESHNPETNPGLQLTIGSIADLNEIPVHLAPEASGSFAARATQLVDSLDRYGGNPASLVVRVRAPGLIRAVLQIADGRIQIDRARTRLIVYDQPTDIATTPFRLLTHLAEHADEPQSAGDLLEGVWEKEWPNSPAESEKAGNLVHSNIRRVREVLGSPLDYQAIINHPERGIGYIAVSSLDATP